MQWHFRDSVDGLHFFVVVNTERVPFVFYFVKNDRITFWQDANQFHFIICNGFFLFVEHPSQNSLKKYTTNLLLVLGNIGVFQKKKKLATIFIHISLGFLKLISLRRSNFLPNALRNCFFP